MFYFVDAVIAYFRSKRNYFLKLKKNPNYLMDAASRQRKLTVRHVTNYLFIIVQYFENLRFIRDFGVNGLFWLRES